MHVLKVFASVGAIALGFGASFIGVAIARGVQGVEPNLPFSFRLPWTSGAGFDDHGDRLTVNGSWVTDSSSGTTYEMPVNTVEISCHQTRALCSAARAYLIERTGFMIAEIQQYEVISWTPDRVIAALENDEATFELTFDRMKKVVTMKESVKPLDPRAVLQPSYAHLGGGGEATTASGR